MFRAPQPAIPVLRAAPALVFALAALLPVTSLAGDSMSPVAEGATLQLAADGFAFTEGPAADAMGNVYFTDQPNDRILKWTPDGEVSVFLQPSERANGLTFDRQGRLLACADEHNRLLRIAPDGAVEVLLDGVDGKRFNGPNDAWVAPDGGIYFTDPYYQRDYWSRTEPELDSENLYYLSPQGRLSVADGELVKPNGLVGTPAGDRLYVADIGADRTWVYDREADGRLVNRRLFAPMGSDGMTLDSAGNLYLTGDGVTVFDARGTKILHIPVDEDWTANVTFGGPNRDILFITAMDSVYTLQMAVRGAP